MLSSPYSLIVLRLLVWCVNPIIWLFEKARAIQELAKKKFHRLRAGIERSEKELKPEKELNLEKELRLEKDLKSEPKTKSSILVKKQTKKHFSRTIQEPVGSDFSSGATLATTGDIQNGSVATQAGGCERPTNTDAIVDGNSSLADNNLEKVEELSSGITAQVVFWNYDNLKFQS